MLRELTSCLHSVYPAQWPAEQTARAKAECEKDARSRYSHYFCQFCAIFCSATAKEIYFAFAPKTRTLLMVVAAARYKFPAAIAGSFALKTTFLAAAASETAPLHSRSRPLVTLH